ncbi:MAG: hypothetical protein ABF306_12880 [Nocardioides marinisabuli]|uniref:hypothetical protein n=1 Tax=Nocardioides marinisabuli TaxID=419476 RepID=UPI003219D3BA
MTAWVGATSASAAAHTVHYALVVGGLVALAGLLGARLLPAAHRAPDAHDLRVAALRHAAATGTLQLRPLATTPAPAAQPRAGTAVTLLLPLALVSSAAAAGVHAAMGPAHLREQTLFGLFFAAAALAQLAWTAAALQRPGRPSRRLLLLGAAGNAACLGLWALTRTVGLPLDLMGTPEAVGAWDLAAVAWQLVVVGACVALLRGAPPAPGGAPAGWHPAATAYLGVSVTALALLSLSGAGG